MDYLEWVRLMEVVAGSIFLWFMGNRYIEVDNLILALGNLLSQGGIG